MGTQRFLSVASFHPPIAGPPIPVGISGFVGRDRAVSSFRCVVDLKWVSEGSSANLILVLDAAIRIYMYVSFFGLNGRSDATSTVATEH
ncbi:hypothetical protein U1Q18_024472 [Sarracenia purpurea var. burkii]